MTSKPEIEANLVNLKITPLLSGWGLYKSANAEEILESDARIQEVLALVPRTFYLWENLTRNLSSHTLDKDSYSLIMGFIRRDIYLDVYRLDMPFSWEHSPEETVNMIIYFMFAYNIFNAENLNSFKRKPKKVLCDFIKCAEGKNLAEEISIEDIREHELNPLKKETLLEIFAKAGKEHSTSNPRKWMLLRSNAYHPSYFQPKYKRKEDDEKSRKMQSGSNELEDSLRSACVRLSQN